MALHRLAGIRFPLEFCRQITVRIRDLITSNHDNAIAMDMAWEWASERNPKHRASPLNNELRSHRVLPLVYPLECTFNPQAVHYFKNPKSSMVPPSPSHHVWRSSHAVPDNTPVAKSTTPGQTEEQKDGLASEATSGIEPDAGVEPATLRCISRKSLTLYRLS